MNILGINDGYAATAALLQDGRVTLMAGEERFNGKKNYSGFPRRAVEWIMAEAGLTPGDIEALAFATRSATITDDEPFSTGRHRFFAVASRLAPWLVSSDAFIRAGVKYMSLKRTRALGRNQDLSELGLDRLPRSIHDHHDCHAATAYFASGFREKHDQTLVVSYDGSGDGFCCRIFLASGGTFKPLHAVNSFHSLGILYSRLTQFMGMKPMEHEYKVMGMAPYADPKRAEEVARLLDRVVRLSDDGLSMVNVSRAWGDSMVDLLGRLLKGQRFDWIAAGGQLHFERIMTAFIQNWVRKTGVRNLAVGGGSFMNVKLNMLLGQNDEIEDAYFTPSCGDESEALGAAYLKAESLRAGSAQPLGSLYLGHRCSEEDILAVLERHGGQVSWQRVEDPEEEAARLLAEHKIVARCRGRMEWGSRALGNRSILANPSSMRAIQRINKAIKKRDFWMPFAPSILHEHRHDYLIDPRNLDAPYMILAFESTPRAHEDLQAALHPFDLTCRPQVVTRDCNPEYHRLISGFKERTGIGGVLNTSFNLHGYPIVRDAEDSLFVFVNSDLDALVLENYLVTRR